MRRGACRQGRLRESGDTDRAWDGGESWTGGEIESE